MSTSEIVSLYQQTFAPGATAQIEAKISEGFKENERLRKKFDRNQKLLITVLSLCILLGLGMTMYFYGIMVFSLMPE